MSKTVQQIWFFHWLGSGSQWQNGYNVVFAGSKTEAIKQIEERFGDCNLKPDLTTLRVETQEFIDKVDRSYSGMFD